MHPAVQLCVPRNGGVVIDRAIGHARGNGAGATSKEDPVAVGTETPFCVFSTAKASTTMVVDLRAELLPHPGCASARLISLFGRDTDLTFGIRTWSTSWSGQIPSAGSPRS